MPRSSGRQYRGQKADAAHERIFGVFLDGSLAATARCTRHPDGLEMDCVFVPEQYRGKGYAGMAVEALLRACGSEQIFIHSTLVLIPFYKRLGFVPIPEAQLPQTIRERFIFCFGEMAGLQCLPDEERGGRGRGVTLLFRKKILEIFERFLTLPGVLKNSITTPSQEGLATHQKINFIRISNRENFSNISHHEKFRSTSNVIPIRNAWTYLNTPLPRGILRRRIAPPSKTAITPLRSRTHPLPQTETRFHARSAVQ